MASDTASPLQLHLLEPQHVDGELRLAAELREPGGGRTATLRVAVPEHQAGLVTRRADPFVVGLALLAMELGRPVHVHGRVSPVLLRNLEEFMAYWALWRRRKLRAVRWTADDECEAPAPPDPDRALCAFSGGLDSCFTAWRHAEAGAGRMPGRARRRRRLTHGVLVRGLEKHLWVHSAWERVEAATREMLGGLGLELLTVSMNFTDIYTRKRFFNAWGACVSASLMLFQEQFGVGLVPAGGVYTQPFPPEPTDPSIAHLLSTAHFRSVSDGNEVLRTHKSVALADWHAGGRGLRVCGAHGLDGRNCGRCEKCVRTIFGFLALGQPVPACFPDFDPERLPRLRIDSGISEYFGVGLLQVAAEQGRAQEAWAAEVGAAMRRFRRRRWLKVWRDRLGYGVLARRAVS